MIVRCLSILDLLPVYISKMVLMLIGERQQRSRLPNERSAKRRFLAIRPDPYVINFLQSAIHPEERAQIRSRLLTSLNEENKQVNFTTVQACRMKGRLLKLPHSLQSQTLYSYQRSPDMITLKTGPCFRD